MKDYGSGSEESILMIESLELQDFSLVGSKFTFFDRGLEGAQSRLDKFFVKDNDSRWSNGVVQQAIFKYSSDHLPILLALDLLPLGPWPFRFF